MNCLCFASSWFLNWTGTYEFSGMNETTVHGWPTRTLREAGNPSLKATIGIRILLFLLAISWVRPNFLTIFTIVFKWITTDINCNSIFWMGMLDAKRVTSHQHNEHEFGQNPGDSRDGGGGWHAMVHQVAKSQAWLSNWTTTILSLADAMLCLEMVNCLSNKVWLYCITAPPDCLFLILAPRPEFWPVPLSTISCLCFSCLRAPPLLPQSVHLGTIREAGIKKGRLAAMTVIDKASTACHLFSFPSVNTSSSSQNSNST